MTDLMPEVVDQSGGKASDIRPFRVNVSSDALADLDRRLKSTRWADKEPVTDWTFTSSMFAHATLLRCRSSLRTAGPGRSSNS